MCIIWQFDPRSRHGRGRPSERASERCRREIKCQKASLLQRTTDDSICFALISSLSLWSAASHWGREMGVWHVRYSLQCKVKCKVVFPSYRVTLTLPKTCCLLSFTRMCLNRNSVVLPNQLLSYGVRSDYLSWGSWMKAFEASIIIWASLSLLQLFLAGWMADETEFRALCCPSRPHCVVVRHSLALSLIRFIIFLAYFGNWNGIRRPQPPAGLPICTIFLPCLGIKCLCGI